MALLTSAHAIVAYHEGCELHSYQDTTGVWTIGFGHTGPGVCSGLIWTPAQASAVLDQDLAVAESDAAHLIGITYGLIEPPRQAALIDLSFNLGLPKFSQFITFLDLAAARNWQEAAGDLLNNTAWAKELPRRAADDASLLTTGEWLNV